LLTFVGTQEEAAEAYDIAAIKFRGLNAVTNFDMSRYDVKSIMESRIPIGGSATKRTKDMPVHSDMDNGNDASHLAVSKLLTDGIGSYGLQHGTYDGWAPITFLPPALQCSNGHGYSRMWCKKDENDGAVVATAHSLHNPQHFPTVQSTHNFFLQSAVQEVMHYPDMHPQLVDSNSGMYTGGVGYHGAVGHSSYAMPVAKLVPHAKGDQAASSSKDVGTVSDLYNGQNFYYYSQDSHLVDPCKDNTYEQSI
jgi:AP2-like factor, ANT lineage